MIHMLALSFTLAVPAAALQVSVGNPGTDWAKLHKRFQSHDLLAWDICETSTYMELYKALPPMSLDDLMLPPNAKVLFYGTSYLHQILANILAANQYLLADYKPNIDKWFGQPGGKMMGDNVDPDASGYLVRWDFTDNTTIWEVQNYEKFQKPKTEGELEKFLKQNEFDIAFYMNPHSECWFPDHSKCATGAELGGNCSLDPDDCWCVADEAAATCSKKYRGDFLGERSDMAEHFKVINKAVKHVYEVEAWATEEREWWHADGEHVIRTHSKLAGRACNLDDDCSNSDRLHGHQCQPGRLTLVAHELMAKVRQQLRRVK